MIKISHLSKHYAGAPAPALDDISLTIEEGTIFGILGRSGAGKSTLLRCLNRLESPSSGQIEIDGQDLAAMSLAQLRQQRQQMGMIFQHFNLLHSRNVQDNVDLALEIAGLRAAERRQRVGNHAILFGRRVVGVVAGEIDEIRRVADMCVDLGHDRRQPVVDRPFGEDLARLAHSPDDVEEHGVAVGGSRGVDREAAVDEEAVDARRAGRGRCGAEGVAEYLGLGSPSCAVRGDEPCREQRVEDASTLSG